ncbi:MAG: hypothetical protein ACK4M3_02425 [Pyrobaculum sp.]
MEFIFLTEVGSKTVELVKKAIYTLGPPPIDVVIFGADVTRLETEDVFTLKVSLPLDIYQVMRETATAHALASPDLLEVWVVPHDVRPDPLAYELSQALLARVVDMLVAKASPELVVERARVEVVEGETVVQTLVKTLAVDVSISLAVAGHIGEAARLLNRLAGHPIYETYRRLWDFATANFKFLPIYNWLNLLAPPR